MPRQQTSNVDAWLKRETPRVRRALESASRHFDGNDHLTVNTLEAVYGQESGFGVLLGTRGSSQAAGHFQLKLDTAKRYGLSVSRKNDQRFDMDYASSAAARYLKDLDTIFSKRTLLAEGKSTIPIKDVSERKEFVLGAFNAGEGRVAGAQRLAKLAGKNSGLWADVEGFLEPAGAKKSSADEARDYVEQVPLYEVEFATKSPADKTRKRKSPGRSKYRCTEGHWVTVDDRPVFICA